SVQCNASWATMLEHSSGFPRARSLLQTEARSSGLERDSTAAGEPDVFNARDDRRLLLGPAPRGRFGPDGDRDRAAVLQKIRERLCEGRLADVVAVHEVAARAGSFADWPEGLDPRLVTALGRRGVTRPYTHQAEAIAAARAGRDVVL